MKKIKRIYKTFLVKLSSKRRFLKTLTTSEQTLKKLILSSMNGANTIFLVAPISDHIFIKVPDKEVTILISSSKLKVANHIMFYEIDVRTDFASYLKNIVKGKIERERIKLENSIFLSKIEMTEKLIENIIS